MSCCAHQTRSSQPIVGHSTEPALLPLTHNRHQSDLVWSTATATATR
jgi:hypothetical protein